MQLTLQPAGPADLAAVAHLMNAAYRGRGEDAGWATETADIAGDRTSEDLLRDDLAATPGAALLLSRPGPDAPLDGCVWLQPLSLDLWYLGSLTVAPTLQNAGFGRALLASAEAWAAARGARTVRITVVNVRTALIAWYTRRGYIATGEIEPFPYGDNRFGTPLRDDLAFV